MPPQIMIVDDDQGIRHFLTEVLQDEGYHVRTENDARGALEVLQSTPELPCVIITDLMMPMMNGWAFCRERLAIPRLAWIPVIVISAIPDLPRDVGVLGVLAAFSKPLDLDLLLSTISECCPSASRFNSDTT